MAKPTILCQDQTQSEIEPNKLPMVYDNLFMDFDILAWIEELFCYIKNLLCSFYRMLYLLSYGSKKSAVYKLSHSKLISCFLLPGHILFKDSV